MLKIDFSLHFSFRLALWSNRIEKSCRTEVPFCSGPRQLSIFVSWQQLTCFLLQKWLRTLLCMSPSKTFRNNHVQRKCRNWNSAWVSNRLMISDGNSDGKNWIENHLNGAWVGEKRCFQNDIWYFVDDKKTKSNSFLRSVTNDFKVAAREQWSGR